MVKSLINKYCLYFILYVSYLSNVVSHFVAYKKCLQIIKMTYGIIVSLALVFSQSKVSSCVTVYCMHFFKQTFELDTLLRTFTLHITHIYTYHTSFQQLFTSQNIYCEEAVKSVKIVTSCPTSKTEWDIAAFRKNCSGIASRQICVKKNEKFQYHCVINGMRNKLVEVCAPTRIIFGISFF